MTTYSTDPALFIFTSLTAGSSHIVTATSRLETILRANRVPFKAVDLATDQKARMLWSRRAGKDEGGRVRKLPGLVQEGLVLGDLVEIEDWNEYGELKQHVKIYYDENTIPNIHHKFPVPVFKKRPLKKSAATPAASTAASTAAAPAAASTSASAIPTPPPMPEAKATPASDASATTRSGTGKAQPEKAAPLPIRSVADEAAAKAKELRLKSLREKVHGKEGAAELEKANKAEAEDKTTPAAPVAAASVPAKKESEESEEEDSDDDDDDDDVSETEKAKKGEDEGKETPAAPVVVAAAAAAATPAPNKKAKEEPEEDDSDDSSEEESSEEDSEEDSSDEDEDAKTTTTSKPKPAAIATTSTEATPSTPIRASSVADPLAAASTKPPGLQSPTSGTWRHGSQSDSLARETLQSPTSGKWAQGATVGETMTLHGAEVREVSEEEIKAVECENVIKEEPGLEEEEGKKETTIKA